MSPQRPKKEYYAVFSGRVDEPTIFSSWGDAHPRVTGCDAVHKGFSTLMKAREYMSKKGVADPKVVIKHGAGETTLILNGDGFYAVAHGKRPGIRQEFSGPAGSELEVKEVKNACHKKFRTRDQAEAFIEDWKESFSDVWRRAIREGLDQGLRPYDMKVNINLILHKTDDELDAFGELTLEDQAVQ